MGVHEHFGQNDARLRQLLDYNDALAPSDGQAPLWIASSGKFAPRSVLLPSQVGVANGVAPLDAGGLVPIEDLPTGTGANQVTTGSHTHDSRYSRGVIARAQRTSNSSASSSTTPVGVLRVAGSVVNGRLYRVGAPLLMWAANAALSALHLGVAILNFTTDGSNPTPSASANLLAQTHTPLAAGLPTVTPVHGACTIPYRATFTGTLSIALSIYRGAGTATSLLLVTSAAYPIDLLIEDCGVDPGASGASL